MLIIYPTQIYIHIIIGVVVLVTRSKILVLFLIRQGHGVSVVYFGRGVAVGSMQPHQLGFKQQRDSNKGISSLVVQTHDVIQVAAFVHTKD